jgi:hypothetical protein
MIDRAKERDRRRRVIRCVGLRGWAGCGLLVQEDAAQKALRAQTSPQSTSSFVVCVFSFVCACVRALVRACHWGMGERAREREQDRERDIQKCRVSVRELVS